MEWIFGLFITLLTGGAASLAAMLGAKSASMSCAPLMRPP
jgi:hypothetical protein